MVIDGIMIAKIVLLGLIHWMLVPLALQSLLSREHVIGRRKAPWALTIISMACVGSLIYLIFHPQLEVEPQAQTERWY